MGKGSETLTIVSQLDRRPIYVQLRAAFLELIRTGEWQVGRILPNEVQLAGSYKVSVGTIRKVMDELSELGLVKRQQGRGTFVSDPGSLDGCTLFDSIRDAEGNAIRWDPTHLEVRPDVCTSIEAKSLGRPRSTFDVLRMTWLHSRSRRALALDYSVVPVDTGIDVDRARHADGLRELFSQAGVLVIRSEDHLSVDTPDQRTAERLKVAPDRPLQRVSRRFFAANGDIVALCSSWLALKTEHYACVQSLRPVGVPH